MRLSRIWIRLNAIQAMKKKRCSWSWAPIRWPLFFDLKGKFKTCLRASYHYQSQHFPRPQTHHHNPAQSSPSTHLLLLLSKKYLMDTSFANPRGSILIFCQTKRGGNVVSGTKNDYCVTWNYQKQNRSFHRLQEKKFIIQFQNLILKTIFVHCYNIIILVLRMAIRKLV